MRKLIFSLFWCAIMLLFTFQISSAQVNNEHKYLHPSPQGAYLRWVKMWDANNWYAAGYGATFMKTSNGGSTWTVYNSFFVDGSYGYDFHYDAFFINMNTGWMCGNTGKIFKTTNAGVTWDTSITAISSGVTWYDLEFLDANTGFAAGTSTGRVAMTTDGGATWSMMGTPPSATYYGVYAKDANNVIATSTAGNIRKTTDGGTTWTTISTGASSTLYKVNFLNANTGYVCGSSTAIRYTTDFGDTWTSTNTGVASSTFYDIDFTSNTLPAPTLSEGFDPVAFPPTGWAQANLLGTKQWSRSTTNPHTGSAVALSDWETTGGVDWLRTNSNAVYAGDSLTFWLRRSYTGASFDWDSLQIWVGTSADTSTMTKILALGVNNLIDTTGNSYPPRPGTYKRYAVNMSSFAGQNVFIAFRHSNLDGTGVRLDDLDLGLSRPSSQDNVIITGNSFNLYTSPVGQDAFDTLQILDNSQPWTGTFYSTDLLGDTITSAGQSGMINTRYSPSNRVAHTNWIKAGNFYDIWAESTTGRVIAVGSPGIAGSVFDQVMYSTNGGQDWAIGNFSGTADEDLNSICMINATTGFVAGDEGGVHKTTDGGATWTELTATGTTTELEKAVFLNANTGYVFGDDGNNYKTTNGGTSWSPYTWGGGTNDVYGAFFVDVNTGWAVGQSGDVYKTTDGGATTTSQDAGVGTSIIYDIFMLNANTGWLTTTTGRVRHTSDGGTTWDTVDVPFSSTCQSVFFTDPLNGMVTGSTGAVFRTRDGGNSWESTNIGYSTPYQVYMTATNRAFICGSIQSVYQYQETVTGNGINFTNNVPDKYFLDQNYPNPFNPSTTIKFGLPKEGTVSLRIYDIAGREVSNIINNQRMNAGIVSYNFNGSALASGVYFYTLVVDNNLIATKKMVLVK
ncbi:MAG: T9SS type A sorting domain-containing protein [Ignavibacteriae bacterium]|nr:T9SS type A sorting domain-containing protein [Ignavibacteriota bacterium]MCB9243184.1 T9SS type A sorting domain-containing protein [Ignavibacteriales bacterium]